MNAQLIFISYSYTDNGIVRALPPHMNTTSNKRGGAHIVTTMATLSSVVILLAIASYAIGGPLPPYNLKCQGNHVGLSVEKLQNLNKHKLFSTDNPNPIFSWTVAHTKRAARQTAFQVIVATDQNMKNIIWNSGKVLSQYETSLKYAGPPLQTGKTYFWKVIWWDHSGDVAVSEETGHFLVGVLEPKQWEAAKWIAAGDDIKTAPYLHKTFQIGSTGQQSATLMVAGLGFHKVFVNNVDLGAHYDPPMALTPGWTNYEKLVPYTTYNIPLSNFSSLTIGVMLGRGWRNTGDYALKDPGGIPTNDSTERVLKVLMYYFDYSINSSRYLISDESWSADETNITSDSIYNGYTYGAATLGRKLVVGSSVKVVTGPSGQMYLTEMPYIAEVGVEKPVKIYSMSDYQVVDFGNNSAGYCQVYCEKEANGVTIHHAEVPMHKPYGNMDGSLYFGNLRGAKATDTYSGEANSTFKPSFTYHGFRYAEVRGMTVTDANIQKIIVNSNLTANSKFESSIPLLNNIQENCVRGQLSNLMSVVTDCNQRDERLGWMGDATLSAETMTLNFDMQAFHTNFLEQIQQEMINGTIPDVVPFYRYGSRPADPSWSAAFPEILYRIATYDKNMDVTGKYYPGVLDYVKTTLATIPADQGISKLPNCHYGDWVPPPPNPKVDNTFTGAFSFMMSVKQTKEMADLLGKKDDSTMLEQTFEKLIGDFNKGFMTSDTQYLNGIQATYVLPLAVGAVADDKMDAFVKAFLNRLEDPKQDNSHVTGGITTTRHFFSVLTQIKQHDIALKIAQQTDYPSYGYMIHNDLEPATAIWELWNSPTGSAGMDSRNHHMYSSISGWMVTDMAGLSLTKGFNEIHFHPARTLGLSHVSVSLEHPKPVHLLWRRNGGIQCTKQAENQSPLNPNLPKHNDLTISCGDEDGGTIEKILFASYGNPTGHCGGYHKLGSCHATNSVDVVEKLCLGKRSCIIPTGADFWGNPCPDIIKWLSVSVQCKSEFVYSSIRVNVSVPMGSRGLLHLPAHGKHNMKLWDGEKIIFSESSSLNPTLGITYAKWESDSDSLILELASGHYDFTWKGDNPKPKCLDSRSSLAKHNILLLECANSTDVITTIHWASYGTPELTAKDACSTHVLGECHAGSSKFAIERECLGKSKCAIHAGESFFGKLSCLGPDKLGHLIAEYTCNSRKY